MAAQDFHAGDWLVQPTLGAVSRAGSSTHLEPKAMGVLARLAERPGQVVSKDELIRFVWPDVFVTDNVLTTAVWQLRQALGADAIQTVSRRGYRLNLPVRAGKPTIRSLAVLPLVNLSGDPAQEYFADGMTEALITALAQVSGLRVISRTSVMPYKSTTRPMGQIGAELNVDGAIEGSVTRIDDRVRVAVQLVHAASDCHLWAKNFDGHLRDVLDMQDEMARAIAAEVDVTLTPEEHSRLARPRPVNPAAQDAYMLGRYYHSRATEESVARAIECMRQAIAIDPRYALAHATLASFAGTLCGGAIGAISPAEAVAIIRPAVQRALELDPDLSEALVMQGWLRLFWEWDWNGAEAALLRTVALSPSYAAGHATLAWLHAALGRGDEAIASWRQACSLDPLSMFSQAFLGWVLGVFGHYDEAIVRLRSAIALEPRYHYPHSILSGALAMAGRFDEAVAEAEIATAMCPDPILRAYAGYAYARAGRTDAARQLLSDIESLSGRRNVGHIIPAGILAGLGEDERCLDHLEQSAERHETDIVFVRVFPAWKPLRGHPRFEALVRRLNFPD